MLTFTLFEVLLETACAKCTGFIITSEARVLICVQTVDLELNSQLEDTICLLSFSLKCCLGPIVSEISRSGELRTQKLKSHLMRTQSLKVLPLKPGVGQHIAMHATLTARDFFLANFYPSGSFACIFPKPLPSFSCVSCA